MNIQPLTPAIGADVYDLDLGTGISDANKEALQQAFFAHHVLLIRNQSLSSDHLLRFARCFGHVGAYPFAKPLPGYPEIIAIIKEPEQTSVFGGIWHTDSTYLPKPSMASVLYAVEVPAVGGDTLFSNQHAAFESLDTSTKKKLRKLTAEHSSAKNQQKLRTGHLATGSMQQKAQTVFTATHPVVRTHPVTGRESLYLSPAHTTHINGLPQQESDALLETLFAHALRDDFKCRVRWQPGTVAIWDNRCTLHYPVNDYHGHRREMHRITIDGDKPF